MVIGTFGRAAWVLDDIRPLRALASDRTILNKETVIFTPPTAYQASYQQPTGSRFGGDALYQGENRKSGAMITYFLKEGKKDMKKDDNEEKQDGDKKDDAMASTSKKDSTLTGVQKKDSIQFDFYDGNRLIRTLKYKTPEKAGFHRIYWGMDEKGPDRPSRTISKSKNESGGIDVKPGTYKVKMSFGNLTDETTVQVKSDPRLDVNSASISEVYETGKSIEKMTQIAADAVKQLVESKTVAEKFSKELKEKDEKKYKDQIKASNDIIKEIDSVIALYLGKDDKRQGITRNPEITVMQRIQNANRYAGSRKNGITKTERDLIKYAEDELKMALDKTNSFFGDKWKAYRESIESLDVSPFKETETFRLK